MTTKFYEQVKTNISFSHSAKINLLFYLFSFYPKAAKNKTRKRREVGETSENASK